MFQFLSVQYPASESRRHYIEISSVLLIQPSGISVHDRTVSACACIPIETTGRGTELACGVSRAEGQVNQAAVLKIGSR